jgi:hypothetical protein
MSFLPPISFRWTVSLTKEKLYASKQKKDVLDTKWIYWEESKGGGGTTFLPSDNKHSEI